MRRRFIGGQLMALAMLLPLPALAWTDEEWQTFFDRGQVSTVIDIDNDTLLLSGSDRFYTSGLRLSKNYRLPSNDGWESLGWRVGQQLYTASSIRRLPEALAVLDRPYAGWLYAGLVYRREANDGSEIAYGLDIGCLGPCAGGEWSQESLHRALHQPRPKAWSTQIGTEPGAVVMVGARGPYYALGPQMDLRPGVAVRLGNIFTDISAEGTLRAGVMRTDPQGSGRYVFFRVAARAVAHDATLQGGWLTGTEARTVSPKHLTGEAELGVQWQLPRWALRVSVIRRSNEINGLSESLGRQDFLRLSLMFTR
ncbi:MAG: lipid A-modifier LpxR family protein [Oxalobacteraceae bacterium]